MIPAGEPDAEAEPAPGPDHLGRHRRGPRPPGPRGRPRVQGRGPRRPGLDRQRPAGDGRRPDQGAARELGVHVHAGVPWLFDFQYRLFMYFAPTRWLSRSAADALRAPRADAADPRPRPGRDRLHLPGRDRGARRAAPQTAARRSPATPRSPTSPACSSGPTPGSTCTSSPIPESTEEVEQIAGPGSVRWAKPPTSPAFLAARSRADARKALALPADGKVIAVSGGGWGVGDLVGATRAALRSRGRRPCSACAAATTSCAPRWSSAFGGEPRLRVMGFTDRMGDVLAAADALVHSSAGLTVLEAIIRGCPVISYGFGYGHVRASNAALERFGLAQVARTRADLGARARHARSSSGPSPTLASPAVPSTASLILVRRAAHGPPLPRWRRAHGPRGDAASPRVLAFAGLALTTGASYTRRLALRAHAAGHRGRRPRSPRSACSSTLRPPRSRRWRSTLSAYGLHASFALDRPARRGRS